MTAKYNTKGMKCSNFLAM